MNDEGLERGNYLERNQEPIVPLFGYCIFEKTSFSCILFVSFVEFPSLDRIHTTLQSDG